MKRRITKIKEGFRPDASGRPGHRPALLTPFFALLLLTLLSVGMAAAESARTASLKLYADQAMASAVSSAFGRYDSALFDETGLMFFSGGEDGLLTAVQDELTYYAHPGMGTFARGRMEGFRSFSAEQVTARDVVRATDRGGLPFEREAIRALGQQAAQAGVHELMSRWDILSGVDAFREKSAQLQQKADQLLGLEKKYKAAKDATQKLREAADDVRELRSRIRALETSVRGILTEQAGYASLRSEVEELVASGKEELSGALADALEESGKAVLAPLSGKDLLQKMLEEAKTADTPAEDDAGDGGGEDGAGGPGEETPGGGGGPEETSVDPELERLTALRDRLLEISEEAFGKQEPEDAETTGKGRSLMDRLRALRTDGVLALVTEGDLSDRVITGAQLPSRIAGKAPAGEETLAESLLFQAYLALALPAYTDGEGTYDLEYVWGKSGSDRDNLASAAGAILAVREGLNLAYLYTDTAKRVEAEQIAGLICGAAGMPLLTPAATFLLLSGWALCESVGDVRMLLRGEKVLLFKTHESWRTSLTGLLGGTLFADGSGDAGGISYKTYLMALLLVRDRDDKRLRAMDVIEDRIRRTGKDFRFSRCIAQAEVHALVRVPALLYRPGGDALFRTHAREDYAVIR